ncbi:MAG: sulfotransferase [Planctomycetaceae bacterium]|nr:sulfotransferase [Planctomycetaceae bacterium]
MQRDRMDTKNKPKESGQGGLTLWHGMTLRQMVRLAAYGPILHWKRTHRIVTLPGFGLYNSLMALAERIVYGRKIAETRLAKPPLFVIGHWRSGTTLLHNLLAQDPQFNFPNLYECVFPNHFLLTEKVITRLTRWMIPNTRPMDNVPAGWDCPQEEDIAMAILTCLSPYMLCARPDRNDLVRPLWDLSLLSEQETAEWKAAYVRFLTKVSLGDRRQLVVKTPANTLRIPLLRSIFPDAKFVYIYRNPLDVFKSTVHMRKAMFRENSLGCPRLTDIEDAAYWLQEFTHRTYERDKKSLPAGSLHEVRFEDLEQDPLGEMQKVYETLNLEGWDDLEAILSPQVPSLRRYKKNKFQPDQKQANECYSRLRMLFEHHGYDHPLHGLERAA